MIALLYIALFGFSKTKEIEQVKSIDFTFCE